MEEIWKPIKDYEELYEVSNLGRVRRLPKRMTAYAGKGRPRVECFSKMKILKGWIQEYKRIELRKNGVSKMFFVHRLVAEAFVENPDNKPQVNHIDENKMNNKQENLEWVTSKENSNHGTVIERRKKRLAKISGKPIVVIENGEKIKFQTIGDASEYLDVHRTTVSHALRRNGKVKGRVVYLS